jgi:pyruvate formate lyase activating enzyme
MKIGGLQKVSLIDYPGKVSAIVFTQGCNFRCPYCHNPELVNPDLFGECIPAEAVFSFLDKRRGKLDAVTISGGEPTIQIDLPDFVREIKKQGYLVKLDTNGSRPEVIDILLRKKLLNYVAMDVKGPLSKYESIAGGEVDTAAIRESIELIRSSHIDYEFRTTVLKSLLTVADILELTKLINESNCYVLQSFVPVKILDNSYRLEKSYSKEELQDIKKKVEKRFTRLLIRSS